MLRYFRFPFPLPPPPPPLSSYNKVSDFQWKKTKNKPAGLPVNRPNHESGHFSDIQVLRTLFLLYTLTALLLPFFLFPLLSLSLSPPLRVNWSVLERWALAPFTLRLSFLVLRHFSFWDTKDCNDFISITLVNTVEISRLTFKGKWMTEGEKREDNNNNNNNNHHHGTLPLVPGTSCTDPSALNGNDDIRWFLSVKEKKTWLTGHWP